MQKKMQNLGKTANLPLKMQVYPNYISRICTKVAVKGGYFGAEWRFCTEKIADWACIFLNSYV
jgi:hypothetical protein